MYCFEPNWSNTLSRNFKLIYLELFSSLWYSFQVALKRCTSYKLLLSCKYNKVTLGNSEDSFKYSLSSLSVWEKQVQALFDLIQFIFYWFLFFLRTQNGGAEWVYEKNKLINVLILCNLLGNLVDYIML